MRALVLFLLALPLLSQAQTRPLLVEGTQTIYQRVLTRPGASLHETGGGEERDQFPAFQPLYVYGIDGAWLRVGPSPRRGPIGYVEASEVVPWRQNIVAAFTNPAGRPRQLLFDQRGPLQELISLQAPVSTARGLREAVEEGTTAPGVISIEPEEHIDIAENFYILPILDFEEGFHPVTADPFLTLQVASIPLAAEETPRPEASIRNFQAGVVFVIDTTQSMQPYIDETREAVAEIIRRVEGSEVGNRVNYGIVAFRDNPDATPGLGYRTARVLPLEQRVDQSPVLAALDGLQAATVNSTGFNEDSFAGVQDAIETAWRGDGYNFGGRYIFLITDAGPKRPGDANARSGIDAAALRSLAEEAGVAILTLHLQTAEGIANHAYAAENYRVLSNFPGGPFYYPIPNGDREGFGRQLASIVETFTAQVVSAMEGDLARPEPMAQAPDLNRLGLAMQLAWLGEERGTQVPDLFRAWTTDVSLEDARIQALEPRILITKNELSTLSDVLREAIAAGDAAGDGRTAGEFFDILQGAIARMSVNPDTLVNTEFDTLGEALGEYLADLPYSSRLLTIDRARWVNGGPLRREILDGLRAKLELYREYDRNPALWTKLYEGAPDGEDVFAMPLRDLP